ncbi:MAG: glycoside hydrolase/phage tail family protein [Rhizobiaceae bacterium]|nr:glycoside hydrolase/phage tail family protein [Rhizobiaceae bacterium]
MATLLLQAAGALLGGMFGPVGGAIGSAAGAFAGYAIDKALIDGTRRIEGPRLSTARAFSGEEGASIPRLYGTARLGGIMIWATRFEEQRTTRRLGAKGGPKVTDYNYFANVAFALCEGEIAGIRRVWADGKELDLTTIELRVHAGGPDQPADPLIAAKQGGGNTPAYRGIAYIVLDRFPLADYGNRIPQIQVEVLRPVGGLRKAIRAVCMIPGSTEYGLDPAEVTKTLRPGETVSQNRHVLHGPTDLIASLDELQMLCPNLEHVGLVVSWFGDDLRAEHCRVRPAVTDATFNGFSTPWAVCGVARADAPVVSMHGGGSAYGGTPSDRSVIGAIAEIRSRGLKVTLYPFLMMDIGQGNGLPDPYGGEAQAAYPWRGRITSHPAPGLPGSPDKTAAARDVVGAFCGTAEPGDFLHAGGAMSFTGSQDDWGYRRLILHYAKLAEAAGGVDSFIIGSELRGLTTLRDETNAFPFVDALCDLADLVKDVLGEATAVTYGADWSEYFGHQPPDGSGDVFFHLDRLWARPSIAAVGIDNYMPLSDWRDGDYRDGNPDGADGPCDPIALRAAIDGGEGFDWYYASPADREGRERTAIADAAYGKPWVYRYKDLVGWWSNPHHNRIGGVEQPTPTEWAPRAKPIWLTELGCPAIDKGANQPNVFVDPKSSESSTPHFSNNGRDDLVAKRFLAAHEAHWNPSSLDFDTTRNPLSPVYGDRMLDHGRIYAWCWDARPFPAFPLRSDVWADGANWPFGHWLNGRIESVELADLIDAILADHGLPPADVAQADGIVQGYVVDDPGSARSALEPLVDLFGLAAIERPAGLVFRSARAGTFAPVAVDEMVVEEDGAVVEKVREPDHDLPAEAVLAFRDHLAGFQSVAVRAVRDGVAGKRQHRAQFPGVLERDHGQGLVAEWLRRAWTDREAVSFAVASHRDGIEAGCVVTLPQDGSAHHLVTEVEDGLVRRVRARRIDRAAPAAWAGAPRDRPGLVPAASGRPHVLLLDLPSPAASAAPQDQFRAAAWQKPWKSLAVLASPEEVGFSLRSVIESPADLGVLAEALPRGGISGRIDRSASLLVDLYDAEASSISRLQLLNGGNVAAVRAQTGVWEIVQFETAEEVAPSLWRLAGLLRGQLGTDDAMRAGAAVGADLVILNGRVVPCGLAAAEIGLELNWKVGRSGSIPVDATFAAASASGGLRCQLPLSPVHLRAKRSAGDVAISWVRRSRVDADSWEPAEIALAEAVERYRIEIAAPGGPALRTQTVDEPSFLYAATSIAADFAAPPAEIEVSVRQFSQVAGWGVPGSAVLSL